MYLLVLNWNTDKKAGEILLYKDKVAVLEGLRAVSVDVSALNEVEVSFKSTEEKLKHCCETDEKCDWVKFQALKGVEILVEAEILKEISAILTERRCKLKCRVNCVWTVKFVYFGGEMLSETKDEYLAYKKVF